MFVCDWSSLILIRLLTVLLFVLEMFSVILLSSFKVLFVDFCGMPCLVWKMVAGSKLLIV
jgi:riboflavin transporter FmnP